MVKNLEMCDFKWILWSPCSLSDFSVSDENKALLIERIQQKHDFLRAFYGSQKLWEKLYVMWHLTESMYMHVYTFNLVNNTNSVHKLFLVYLPVSTCFGRLCAHHQEEQLCLGDTLCGRLSGMPNDNGEWRMKYNNQLHTVYRESDTSQMKHQLDATLCRFYFCRVTLHVSGVKRPKTCRVALQK